MSDALCAEQEKFLTSVCGRWGIGTMVKDLGPDILNLVPDPTNYDPWEDKDGPSFPALDEELAAADAAKDYLINSAVILPVGDSQELVRVICWKHDATGALVSTLHTQPALDTHVYEVHFLDCHSKEQAVNVIAEVL